MGRILIIDDDKIIRTSMRAVLEAAGHEVSDAGDANSGLGLQHANPHDAAVVDLFMPDKEGLETIRELRRDYPDLGIIAISGGGEILHQNFFEAAEMFGAQKTLQKPFEAEELLSAIRGLLDAAPSAA